MVSVLKLPLDPHQRPLPWQFKNNIIVFFHWLEFGSCPPPPPPNSLPNILLIFCWRFFYNLKCFLFFYWVDHDPPPHPPSNPLPLLVTSLATIFVQVLLIVSGELYRASYFRLQGGKFGSYICFWKCVQCHNFYRNHKDRTLSTITVLEHTSISWA